MDMAYKAEFLITLNVLSVYVYIYSNINNTSPQLDRGV